MFLRSTSCLSTLQHRFQMWLQEIKFDINEAGLLFANYDVYKGINDIIIIVLTGGVTYVKF